MEAVVYDSFGALPELREVSDPVPPPGGAVLAVKATGLCRSDWHGWRGHDPDIRLPHVPGHEFAGEIAAVGAGVTGWRVGERVTAPFVCACGRCASCLAGDQQVCERQEQPGFTHWGSFAELVVVHQAEVNLVRLPDSVGYAAAAALGCRFATALRAVLAQGRVSAGDWVAVHGCGGVGLSAIMVAVAAGARVAAVDVQPAALALAARLGAEITINASTGMITSTRPGASTSSPTTTAASSRPPSSINPAEAAGQAIRDGGSADATPAPPTSPEIPRAAGEMPRPGGGSEAAPISEPVPISPAVGASLVAAAVREVTGGGAHVSLDALGSQETLTASIEGLRRRGRHVQVGLLPQRPVVPMERVIGWELEVVGSHGMPAHAYAKMVSLVATGALRPAELVTGELALADAPAALAAMDGPTPPGIRVILP